jgi:DNA polymerase delta subunit 3
MLYEFHRQQNGKKPDTVHATYLISGTKRIAEPEVATAVKKDGEDEYMQSSPFMNSSMPQVYEGTGASSTLTITLTREEELDRTTSRSLPFYLANRSRNTVTIRTNNLHSYLQSWTTSIESKFIFLIYEAVLIEQDLQILSDSSRELQSLTLSEDPITSLTTYGTITNPAVKRRTNRRPPPAPASVPAIPSKPKPIEKEGPKVKAEPKPAQSSSAKDFFGKEKEKTSTPASSENTPAPPTLKKESSNLFKSFAKAKPKLKREDTGTDSEVASAVEDEPMKDVSDDEEETYVPPAPNHEIVDSDRKSRKEREAALKKMMDDDDDNVVLTPEPEPEEEDAEVLEEKKPIKEEEPVVEVSGGRRRGRRKVMKKKTVKDDEGYLGMFHFILGESREANAMQ